jgi:hypothetical protein
MPFPNPDDGPELSRWEVTLAAAMAIGGAVAIAAALISLVRG